MTRQHTAARRGALKIAIGASAIAFAVACSSSPALNAKPVAASLSNGSVYVVHDTTIDTEVDASGVASPIQQATLSTKVMGAVTEVLVREGDLVVSGQPLVRIDARELTAKSAQIAASVAECEVVFRDATVQARRLRALYADSAATRAQLDAAETALSRAEAALNAAHAGAAELGAISSYSVVRAPFAGTITRRFVDAGAFATPGAPLVAIQDASTLRIVATTTPDMARRLRRNMTLGAQIERTPARATIEGIVPAATGNLYTINALVSNPNSAMLAGSRATIFVPTGKRQGLVAPLAAVVREGDLTGVTLRTAQMEDRRWVRLGRTVGNMIEVTAGLQSGDRVVVPNSRIVVAAGN